MVNLSTRFPLIVLIKTGCDYGPRNTCVWYYVCYIFLFFLNAIVLLLFGSIPFHQNNVVYDHHLHFIGDYFLSLNLFILNDTDVLIDVNLKLIFDGHSSCSLHFFKWYWSRIQFLIFLGKISTTSCDPDDCSCLHRAWWWTKNDIGIIITLVMKN